MDEVMQGRTEDFGARGGKVIGEWGMGAPPSGSGTEPQPYCNIHTFKVTKHRIIA